jgi:hypothetical protein
VSSIDVKRWLKRTCAIALILVAIGLTAFMFIHFHSVTYHWATVVPDHRSREGGGFGILEERFCVIGKSADRMVSLNDGPEREMGFCEGENHAEVGDRVCVEIPPNPIPLMGYRDTRPIPWVPDAFCGAKPNF